MFYHEMKYLTDLATIFLSQLNKLRVSLQVVNPSRILGELNLQMLLVIIENTAKGCSQLSHSNRR